MMNIITSVVNFVIKLKQFLTRDLWKLDFRKLTPLKSFILKHVRIFYLVGRDYQKDRLAVRAAALVYATLLSLVPLLAVMFAVMKGFGFHNKLEPVLARLLEPLGEQAVQTVVPTIINFVENANVTALGTLGFLFFLISSLSIINNMERAVNDIWLIEKVRSLPRRFSEYFSILLLGPLLAFTVVGITASLESYSLFQMISRSPLLKAIIGGITPFVTSWLVFFLLIMFVPNTRVRLKSALYGAFLGGSLWQVINIYFAKFIVASFQSGAKAALYLSFAVLPLFLVWLYFSWTAILIGAEFAFAHQNLQRITWEKKAGGLSRLQQESFALRLMLLIGSKFLKGEAPLTRAELADRLNLPDQVTENLMQMLIEIGLVIPESGKKVRYIPAQSLDKIRLRELIDKLHNYGSAELFPREQDQIDEVITELRKKYSKAMDKSLSDITIRDLLNKIKLSEVN